MHSSNNMIEAQRLRNFAAYGEQYNIPPEQWTAAEIFRDYGPTVRMLDAALYYAIEREWAVFPTPSDGSKMGCTSAKKSNGERWGCTKDPDLITAYFTKKFRRASIGIALEESGLFVVEADTPEGHDVDSLASLRALEAKHGKLPATWTTISPTGSRHYYFNAPKGVEITNSTSKIAKGVDVKGAGGMVVAPPSFRPGKGWYHWRSGREVADAPQWLIDLCAADTAEHTPNAEKQADPKLVAAAMAVIPNDDLDWESWSNLGMACWNDSGGSDAGLEAFDTLSQKSKKYDADETLRRWQHYFRSPPTKIGFGTLHHMADKASPGWRTRFEAEELQRAMADLRKQTRKAEEAEPEQEEQDAVPAPAFSEEYLALEFAKVLQQKVSFFYSWDTARKQAGLADVRIHDLRHSFASFLVNAGRSPYEVQKILGHTQVKTTQRYAHLSPDTLIDAANAAMDAVGVEFAPPVLVLPALPPSADHSDWHYTGAARLPPPREFQRQS